MVTEEAGNIDEAWATSVGEESRRVVGRGGWWGEENTAERAPAGIYL